MDIISKIEYIFTIINWRGDGGGKKCGSDTDNNNDSSSCSGKVSY